MTNSELDQLLRSNRVPELPPDHWQEFPTHVMQEARRRAGSVSNSGAERHPQMPALSLALHFIRKPALAFGVVIFCAGLVLILSNKHRGSRPEQAQLLEARKYYREIQALFPNQVQSIIFDAKGPRLVLADQPTVLAVEPLYLKLCNTQGCRRYVTFSGQRLRFNGQEFEVLSSRQGEVLLVGQHSVWSSASSPGRGAPFKIEVRALQTAS